MRVLIVGMGLVGAELAAQLRAAGHQVVGTTTTPDRVEALRELADDVRVLRGRDVDALRDAARGCGAIAVCAGPNAARAMTPEERGATYHDVLVATAEGVVAAAGGDTQIVALSSLSVYGDAADGLAVIDESSPLSTSQDPSPRNFQAMERTYLQGAPGRACIFRCADIYGAADPPIEAKVRMAHTILRGSVPFAGEALFYRVDVRDVARAIVFAIQENLEGVYNLTHEEVPPTNRTCFDAIGARGGSGPLEFRGELQGPGRPVTVKRLLGTGFRLEHTRPEPVPEAV